MERFVHTNKIKNLDHLREYVENLFSPYLREDSSYLMATAQLEAGEAVSNEAVRLLGLARRWFESIGADFELMREPFFGQCSVSDACEVTALGLLNPDNHGIVSATERVRTIGEEVRYIKLNKSLKSQS